jgi:hypothetical protein
LHGIIRRIVIGRLRAASYIARRSLVVTPLKHQQALAKPWLLPLDLGR